MNTHFQQTGFGPFSRIFVFGGAYGNLQATEKILGQAEALGFGPHEILFTGDSVAYCGQPQETVDLIREKGILVLQGNCEEALGKGAPNCGCGFEEGSTCSTLSDQWYRFCKSRLNDETKSWMATLPRKIEVNIGGFRLMCTHATPQRINEFAFPSDFDAGRFELQHNDGYDGYVTGHSGIPFIADIVSKPWINSGAAGMPANDGTARVWYATLEAGNGCLAAQTFPVEYDHARAALAMTHAGLTNGYRECLFTGIWPSHDVLPEEEKQRTGEKLKAQAVEFTACQSAMAG